MVVALCALVVLIKEFGGFFNLSCRSEYGGLREIRNDGRFTGQFARQVACMIYILQGSTNNCSKHLKCSYELTHMNRTHILHNH